MTVELEETRVQLANFQKQCDEYLVIIVQQKRDAEEQEKTVLARSEKIAEEETRCLQLAEAAQKDLDEALPALQAAMEALKSLNKKDLGEVKSYPTPPELVETVMQAVMILRQSDPSWAEAKRQLGDPQFIKQLVEFDKDNMSDKGEFFIIYYIPFYPPPPPPHPFSLLQCSRELASTALSQTSPLTLWVECLELPSLYACG